MRKNIKLSSGDKLSIVIALIALFSAMFTTYFQFFHKSTDFSIGNVDIRNSKDSLHKEVSFNLLFLNTGTNPVAITEWFSFFSADKSLPNGTCYNSNMNVENNALFTYGCSEEVNKIIPPNNVDFIEFKLRIENSKFTDYIKANNKEGIGEQQYLNVGVHMQFVDSIGKKKTKELILGAILYQEYSTHTTFYKVKEKDLVIY